MAGARTGGRGAATRARVVAAADALFRSQGYIATTMAAIAAEAGVAVQTLYLSFGSKAAILEAVHDLAVVGDDQPTPVLERPWVAEARAEPDAGRALALILTGARRINDRVVPIYGVIQAAAADAEVAAILEQIRAQRLTTMRALTELLAAKPGFRRSQSVESAADILYAVASMELLELLVVQRGWSSEDLDAWALDVVAPQLFDLSASSTP